MKMYSLSCKDMDMPKCGFVAMGESQEEVIKAVDDHFMKAHPKEARDMMNKKSREEMREEMMEKVVEKDDEM